MFAAQESVSTIKADRNNAEFKSYDSEVEYWKKEIDLLDDTVSLLNENLARNPEGYGISGKTFVTQIQAVQETKVQYRDNYQKAVRNRLTALSEALCGCESIRYVYRDWICNEDQSRYIKDVGFCNDHDPG